MAKSVRIEGAGPSFPLKMEARLNVMEIALISVVQIGKLRFIVTNILKSFFSA